ncbi:MAG TPA: hypothetical protein VJ783_09755 [Pirellulales bacterium]|nr:hypothetical protein [Pirellulales bacterium]
MPKIELAVAVDRSRRQRWSNCAAVLYPLLLILGMAVLYPLSAGPACYIVEATGRPRSLHAALIWFYRPMQAIEPQLPTGISRAMEYYLSWWYSLAH